MTDEEFISKVRKHLSVSRKAGILLSILYAVGLIACLTLCTQWVLLIDADKNGSAFWGAVTAGLLTGWMFFITAGMLALSLMAVFRRGFLFRALQLLLKYHEERR